MGSMRKLLGNIPDISRFGKAAKPLLIITAALLIASVFGTVAASGLPKEVEEEATLLNYEHEGRFDYLHIRF